MIYLSIQTKSYKIILSSRPYRPYYQAITVNVVAFFVYIFYIKHRKAHYSKLSLHGLKRNVHQ